MAITDIPGDLDKKEKHYIADGGWDLPEQRKELSPNEVISAYNKARRIMNDPLSIEEIRKAGGKVYDDMITLGNLVVGRKTIRLVETAKGVESSFIEAMAFDEETVRVQTKSDEGVIPLAELLDSPWDNQLAEKISKIKVGSTLYMLKGNTHLHEVVEITEGGGFKMKNLDFPNIEPEVYTAEDIKKAVWDIAKNSISGSGQFYIWD